MGSGVEGLPDLPMIVPTSLFGTSSFNIFCRRQDSQVNTRDSVHCGVPGLVGGHAAGVPRS